MKKYEEILRSKTALVGFDGFVDKIFKPIIKTDIEGKNVYFNSIKEFGEYLIKKGDKSCSIQMDLEGEVKGGNAPNLAKALQNLGTKVTLVGMLGKEKPLNIFSNDYDSEEIYTFENPGETIALEFSDGKIMLAPHINDVLEPLKKIEMQFGGEEQAQKKFDVDLIALLNWGEIDFMHNLWIEIFEKYISGKPSMKDKFVFFDSADISRHSEKRIENLLKVFSSYSKYRTTILSMNQNEMQIMGEKLLGFKHNKHRTAELLIMEYGLNQVVLHTVDCSYLFQKEKKYEVPTERILNPKISTGAGDNFNAGYCAACLLGLPPTERLTIANRASNYYIRNIKAITWSNIIEQET